MISHQILSTFNTLKMLVFVSFKFITFYLSDIFFVLYFNFYSNKYNPKIFKLHNTKYTFIIHTLNKRIDNVNQVVTIIRVVPVKYYHVGFYNLSFQNITIINYMLTCYVINNKNYD